MRTQRYTAAAQRAGFRSLKDNETVRRGDLIEDIQHGDIAPVKRGKFYAMVQGFKAGSVRQMPNVNDILRKGQ
jgi:hypothetical protein